MSKCLSKTYRLPLLQSVTRCKGEESAGMDLLWSGFIISSSGKFCLEKWVTNLRGMLLKAWFSYQQHQNHLGAQENRRLWALLQT